MAKSCAVVAFFACANGHGEMTWPKPRNVEGEMWFNEGCQIGCSQCAGPVKSRHLKRNPAAYCDRDWMEPTLTDPVLRTWNNFFLSNETARHNPWFAPGFAPVFSPCGLSGGNPWKRHNSNGGVPAPGYKVGFDGRALPKLGQAAVEWGIGSVQEVSWGITGANHGGGYAYRLCPASSNATEECFQTHHLDFEGDMSWIQFGADRANRTAIRANRTAIGTFPLGSQWTKNPIPSCNEKSGGFLCIGGCKEPTFKPPIPGLWGLGPGLTNGCNGCKPYHLRQINQHCSAFMNFTIVDQVRVPAKLPVGNYILSFRWDCEQTPQIWTQCADVKITDSLTMV